MYRWAFKFGLDITKRTGKYPRRASDEWNVDETYIRVADKWRYLRRAADADAQMTEFLLTAQRGAQAAKAVLNKAIDRVRLNRWVAICTENAPTSRRVIREIEGFNSVSVQPS